jgi:hypothetical protein
MPTTTPIPDSVYELSNDFDWSPAAVCAYVTDRWDDADCDAKCTLFDIAAGLYWYCSAWHAGQCSEEYSILSSRLGYNPGALECTVDDAGDGARYVYDMIENAAGING